MEEREDGGREDARVEGMRGWARKLADVRWPRWGHLFIAMQGAPPGLKLTTLDYS